MKTHISKKAIGKLAVDFIIAERSAILAGQYSNAEYFRGKAYSIVECFAVVTEQTWPHAEALLRETYKVEFGHEG